MDKTILLLVVFSCAATLQLVAGECNVCGAKSRVACTSQTEFNFCFDGKQDKNRSMKCPPGTYCTDTSAICGTGPPTCVSYCGKCSADTRFACINETSFALCYGTKIPQPGTIAKCPEGKVCVLGESDICSVPNKTNAGTCKAGEEALIPRSGFTLHRL